MATWSNATSLTMSNGSTSDGATGFSVNWTRFGSTKAYVIRGGNKDGNDYPIEYTTNTNNRIISVLGLTGTNVTGSSMNYSTTRHYWTGSAWSTHTTSAQSMQGLLGA